MTVLTLKPAAVLNKYFNVGDGVSLDGRNIPAKRTTKEFLEEYKALTVAERNELATLAGQELGVNVELLVEIPA